MYRIVIGDDDRSFLKKTEESIQKIMEADGMAPDRDFSVESYDSPPLLWDRITGNGENCHMLLLDVKYADENGMEIAKRLRSQGHDLSLVYISDYKDYVFDCFETKPLWYLLKPLDEKKLAEILRYDYRQRYRQANLKLKIGSCYINIPYHDIYAMESNAHQVYIWLSEEMKKWNGALLTIREQIPGGIFVQCHKSFLVNLSHIREFRNDEVLMDNGHSFPVSRRFYKAALEQYLIWLGH